MTTLRVMTRIAILAAVGLLLQQLEISIFPMAPYLKYDAGDLPVLIGAFALGPMIGACVALLKNVLFVMLRGTPDAFVGAFMNFLAGASFAICAGYPYFLKKTKTRAVLSLMAGGTASVIVMYLANLLILPAYIHLFFPDAPPATSHFLLTVIIPFNVIKAGLNGVLVFLVYKRISPILKAAHWELPAYAPRAPRHRAAARAGRT